MKRMILTLMAACAVFKYEKDNGGGTGGGLDAIAQKLDQAAANQRDLVAENKALKEEITKNVDHWQKENKALMEQLTQVKNKNADDIGELQLAIKRAEFAARREMFLAKGIGTDLRSAISPECKSFLNGFVRARANMAGANYDLTGDQKKSLDGMLNGKALSGSASPGSLELQTRLAREVYDLLPSYGIWSTLGQEQIPTRSLALNVDTVDPIAYIIAENDAIADDTNIAGSQVTATAKQFAVLLKVSNSLLEDAEYDITGKVLKKFLRAIAKRLDYAAFIADGTDDTSHGAFTGVLNFATEKVAASGNTTVETLDFEDITATMLTPGVEALSRQSRWWMHPHILVRLLHIKDSNGRPIFLTAMEAPTPGALGSILGFPVTLGNIMPSTNSAGQKLMAFGDPEAFVVGTRQSADIATSEHYAFNANQTTFRGILRGAVKGRLATGLAYLKTAAS